MADFTPPTGSEGVFNELDPERVFRAVEESYGLVADGSLTNYPSYINRVYGFRTEDGENLVAKFYRPHRWTEETLLDEHRFLLDCEEAEIPVSLPLVSLLGSTLSASPPYYFTLFEKKGGRNFDAESDEDWTRMGSLVGRLHAAGRRRKAEHRLLCSPDVSRAQVSELLSPGLVHGEFKAEFEDLARKTLDFITPHFTDPEPIRLHGDLHRGNILDRREEGLFLMDFDDMMSGPAVQDLWLLLPDYAEDCENELFHLIEGYEMFLPFDPKTLKLIEPLRFMRMIHFLAWQAHQRHDAGFHTLFPDWGNKPFWLKEVEDLRVQALVVAGVFRRE
jgi:Ser/Thr protein kinase RdoA (MazF antagonist)